MSDAANISSYIKNAFLRSKRSSIDYHPIGEESHKSLQCSSSSKLRFIWAHIGLFVLYLTIFATSLALSTSRQPVEEGLIYSPARSAVSYEIRKTDNSAPSPFKLGPSLEAEAAWQQILIHNNLVVSESDLRKVNRTSVELYGQPGYLSFLDFTHQFHCLNHIRQNAYPDYYQLSPNYADEHLSHCMEAIRQILMCHGDISVHTFEHDSTTGKPKFSPTVERECRKYEPLAEWARDHEPIMGHGPILLNPITNEFVSGDEHNMTQAQ
ncbi:hypothetical protein F5Y18DRAFT_127469 [Xylariaceae sp. FL1019]|nr:hypothetical protein F5Y18DRAFT_127469 [Xylariaceae sp. FL1019]